MKQENSEPVPQMLHFDKLYHFVAEVTFKNVGIL